MGTERIVALVAAAGRGERLGAGEPKAFAPLAGEAIVLHTLRRLAPLASLARVVVVVPAGHVAQFNDLVAGPRRWPFEILVVTGGAERQDSVRRGLDVIGEDCGIVLVHDAARPLVEPGLLEACVSAARAHGGAVAAVPVRDTVKRVRGYFVTGTVERRGLWLAQTPQAFRVSLLREAHRRAAETGHRATDDAALVEWVGGPLRVVAGDPRNIKITTSDDLRYAEQMLALAAQG